MTAVLDEAIATAPAAAAGKPRNPWQFVTHVLPAIGNWLTAKAPFQAWSLVSGPPPGPTMPPVYVITQGDVAVVALAFRRGMTPAMQAEAQLHGVNDVRDAVVEALTANEAYTRLFRLDEEIKGAVKRADLAEARLTELRAARKRTELEAKPGWAEALVEQDRLITEAEAELTSATATAEKARKTVGDEIANLRTIAAAEYSRQQAERLKELVAERAELLAELPPGLYDVLAKIAINEAACVLAHKEPAPAMLTALIEDVRQRAASK